MPRYILEDVPEQPADFDDLGGLLVWNGDAVVEESNQLKIEESAQYGRLAMRSIGWDRQIPIPDTVSIVGPNDFEVTVTEEVWRGMQGRRGEVRRAFLGLVGDIMADPHGEGSIDAFKDTDAGQWARVVHSVPDNHLLSGVVPNTNLALKGTGLDMEKARKDLECEGPKRIGLREQFRTTLALQRHQQAKAPEGVGGLVSVNEVFGVVAWRRPEGGLQEWMLMERVVGSVAMENVGLAMSNGSLHSGFQASDHSELAELVRDPYDRYERDVVDYEDVAAKLHDVLGLSRYNGPFCDLNGNNLLYRRTEAGPRYTVIDINQTDLRILEG